MQKILISACLLGNKVRYNGTDLVIENEIIQKWINEGRVVSFCPEVSGGLSTPRPPAEITGGNGDAVLSNKAKVITKGGRDVTKEFINGAQKALNLCKKENITIAILTESSPSCGSSTIYNGELTNIKIPGAGVTSSLLKQHGINVYNQYEIHEAEKYLKKSNIHLNEIEALLFDLGGVVIDVDFDRVFSHWSLCVNQDFETIKTRFKFDSYYERHERGEIDASEYFSSLRRSLDISISDEVFIAGWNSIYVGEIPGVVTILSDIKDKLPIYAFTNSNLTHQSVWSKKYRHILTLFRKVFVSNEMGMRKPEPEAFKAISKEIGVRLDRILFFDDSLENISGAKEIGIQAVRVTSSEDIKNALKAFLL